MSHFSTMRRSLQLLRLLSWDPHRHWKGSSSGTSGGTYTMCRKPDQCQKIRRSYETEVNKQSHHSSPRPINRPHPFLILSSRTGPAMPSLTITAATSREWNNCPRRQPKRTCSSVRQPLPRSDTASWSVNGAYVCKGPLGYPLLIFAFA